MVLKSLNDLLVKGTVATLVGVCLLWALLKIKRNRITFPKVFRYIFSFWLVYLFFLGVGTYLSGDIHSTGQFVLFAIKFLFLFFLLLFSDKTFALYSLKIYAALSVFISVAAILVFILNCLNVPPLTTIEISGREYDYYLLTYYFRYSSILKGLPIFRIQGLSEEPGTYSFSLLPAFYYLVVMTKSRWRLLIICISLVLSMSLGTLITLLAVLPFLKFWPAIKTKLKKYSTITALLIFSLYLISSISYKFDIYAGTTTLVGKMQSFEARSTGQAKVFAFLFNNPFGAGASLGSSRVGHPIAVGYTTAASNAGVFGGLAYFILFGIIGFLTFKEIKKGDSGLNTLETQLDLVAALSVYSILVMGLQRSQPDSSFWHMWILFLFMGRKLIRPHLEYKF